MGNPVEYAEQELGVHTVYEELEAALLIHEECSGRVSACRVQIRRIEAEIADKEAEILDQVWADHSGESGAEKERIYKRKVSNSSTIRRLKADVRDHEDELEREKAAQHHASLKCAALSARLTELGGLLTFYAAAKLAAAAATRPNPTGATHE